MEWKATWDDPLTRYLAPYHELIGDKRTHTTFDEVIKGLIGAGSLICQRIATHSAQLSQGKKGSRARSSLGKWREYEALKHRCRACNRSVAHRCRRIPGTSP